MMRRIRAVLAVGVLAALAGALVGPPPAAADTVWRTVPCATGAMAAEALPGRVVHVTGWIQPCAGSPASTETFAVIYYGSSLGGPRRLLSYADPVAPTQFSGHLDKMPPGQIMRAVCLTFSETGRLSCVTVAVGDDPDRLVVTPIPVDDPPVLVPIDVPRYLGPIANPTCGTCV
jgi:hypothetical protein